MEIVLHPPKEGPVYSNILVLHPRNKLLCIWIQIALDLSVKFLCLFHPRVLCKWIVIFMRMTINNHIFGEDAWALGLVLLRLDRSWLELLVVFNAEHGQQGPVANKSVSLRGSPQAATLPGFVCLFFNSILFYFLKIIYLLIFRQRGREERNIHVWLPLVCPLLGTQPA